MTRRNREIVQEIHRLRKEQEKNAQHLEPARRRTTTNPTLLSELQLLRQRRDELELRMSGLQESRRDLMVQLEGLMTMLKQVSPAASPRLGGRANTRHVKLQRNNSAPSRPSDDLSSVGGDVSQAFNCAVGAAVAGSASSLRNDLLLATDSVTSAMTSLVQQLNVADRSPQHMTSLAAGSRQHRRVVDELRSRIGRPVDDDVSDDESFVVD